MKISAAARVDVGKVRANNEDNLYINSTTLDEDNREERFVCSFCDEKEDFAFAVCDGMGGESRGEDASLAGVRTFSQWLEKWHTTEVNDWKRSLTSFYHSANESVCGLGRDAGAVSGCTCVTLLLRGGSAYFGNLGDSRLYILRGGRIAQLSVDHTLAQLYVDTGKLTRDEARDSRAKHQLMRFLGASDDCECAPNLGHISALREGDRFILCSDGLTDMLTDDDILTVAKTSADCDTVAQSLLDEALDRGGRDNCTVIVVRIDQTDAEPALFKSGKLFRLALCIAGGLAVLTLLLFLLTRFGFWELFS